MTKKIENLPEVDIDEDEILEGKEKKKVTTSQAISSRKSRRRVVFSTLAFSAVILFYIVFATIRAPEHLGDSTLLSTIAIGVLGLSGTVILGYIGGQVYQDNNTARLLAALQARAAIGGKRMSKKAQNIDSVLEE